MKKYKFRLQTVLDMKEKVLEAKMLELSEVVQKYNEEREQLEKLVESKNSSMSELNEIYQEQSELDIFKIRIYKNYLQRVGGDIQKQMTVVENVVKLVKLKQMEVNNALKEKKIFEKLKENEEKKFYKEIEKKESSEIDDIAISRYARK